MNDTLWIVAIGLSVLANGFFAGMETGVTSARRVRLRHWLRMGRRGAGQAVRIVARRENSVVVAVVGNNVAVVTGTSLATAWAIAKVGSQGETIAAVVMAGLNIVFGEILPKTAFRARPERLVLVGAPLFRVLALLLRPLEFLATRVARLILVLFGERGAAHEEGMTRDRLLDAFALSRERSQIDARESGLLADFIRCSHRPVSRIMTPWAEVRRVRETASVREVFDRVRETGHSRLPVVREDGSLIGLLLYRDLRGLSDADIPISRIRDIVRIPESMALDEAIGVLTGRQVSMAVVTVGGADPAGIVTMEDLLEPFMGEILDEHDTDGKVRLRENRKSVQN